MNRSVPESLLICILVLCLALTPISVRGETEDSGKAQQLIEAPGAVLMEKETGTVIYSRDPDTRRSPADRKSTRLNSSHDRQSRMPSSA